MTIILFFLIAAIISFVIAFQQDAPFFVLPLMLLFLCIFCLIMGLSQTRETQNYHDITFPKSQIIVDKTEYYYHLHIKDNNGIMLNTVKINSKDAFEIVESGNYQVIRTYQLDVFNIKYNIRYSVVGLGFDPNNLK